MVGFITEPTNVVDQEEEDDQTSKFKSLKESAEHFDSKFSDLSFLDDSFIDFDSIREFFLGSPDLDRVSLDKIDFGGFEKSVVDMGDKDYSFETNPVVDGSIEGQSFGPVVIREEKVEFEREGNLGSFIEEMGNQSFASERESEREGNLGSFIEEEMGKVSLVGGFSPDCGDVVVVKSEIVDCGMEVKRAIINAPSSVVPDGSVARSGGAGDEMDIGNASLATGTSSMDGAGNGVNNVVIGDENSESSGESNSESSCESSSESSGESNSSSTSSSSSDDEEEEEEEEESNEEEEVKERVGMQLKRDVEEGEIEEGEIREVNRQQKIGKVDEEDEDTMVEWSDVEFDDIGEDEEETGVVRGPIRSQNELKVLPLVPPVDVTLQPNHQMLPVGIVLSIIGVQVIVEGVEKHNPLNEGSILWITEKRSPLGLVDEIFGPVQNPYYVVRYNSENEVPSGINQGTLISFVPEFAYHVLSEKNLYKKGYDASGENDEELSEEAEFSDDEKEAEYTRLKKMSKRGINGQTVGNKKNSKRKNRNRNDDKKNVVPPGQHASLCGGQLPLNQNQLNTSSAVASLSNYSSSSNFTGGAGLFQPLSPMVPTAGLFRPPNGVWVNGFPSLQPQNAVIPGGFPGNNMSWPAQNQIQHPCQMPITSGMPFKQQFNPSQGSLPNGVPQGGQMNPFAGPSPWSAVIGQNCINQAAFGMGFQVQPTQPTMNVRNQGMMSNGLGMEQNCNLQLPVIPGNIQAPHQFSAGASSGRGRRRYNRGGGRFSGERGPKASK